MRRATRASLRRCRFAKACRGFPPNCKRIAAVCSNWSSTKRGAVESAIVRESIHPRYDDQLVSAARKWQYQPATLDGTPVKYRKLVQVNVKQ